MKVHGSNLWNRTTQVLYTRHLSSIIGPFVWVGIAVLFHLIATGGSQVFLNKQDLIRVLADMAVVGLVATSMALVMTWRGLDLSTVGLLALSGVVMVILRERGHSIFWSASAAVGIGVLGGCYVGCLIGKLRVPTVAATLAVGLLGSAVGEGLTGGVPVLLNDSTTLEAVMRPQIFRGYFTPAMAAIAALTLTTSGSLFLIKRRLNRIDDSNEDKGASRPGWILSLLMHGWTGLFVGLAGIAQVAKTGGADPGPSYSILLMSIAAAFIGGNTLKGGEGALAGTLIGAFVVTHFQHTFNAMEWPPWIQVTCHLHIMLLAVTFARWGRRLGLASRGDPHNVDTEDSDHVHG